MPDPINELEMSDEDFLNSPTSTSTSESDSESQKQEQDNNEQDQEQEVNEDTNNSNEEEDTDNESNDNDDNDNGEEEDTEEEIEDEETSHSSQQDVFEDNTDDDEQEELDSEEENDNTSDITSEEAKKVFEPFKANGSEIQVKNADEAIKLMQMGANYTKKMQALRPNLKVLKMLEQQDLLSEEKLSFLIDLNKKDPKAISKLVRDAEIDPVDLDPNINEDDEEYVPKNYSVPDETIQLEQVLEEIQSTPTYSKCIKVIGDQWDSSSRQVLSQNPNLIKQINEQMQEGIFDTINNEIERIKLFGGLSELSDFDAYKQVGAQLYQAGKLGPKPKPIAKTKVANSNKAQDNARTKKRRAASTPKSSSKTTAKKEDFNPLALSDEEFEKLIT